MHQLLVESLKKNLIEIINKIRFDFYMTNRMRCINAPNT